MLLAKVSITFTIIDTLSDYNTHQKGINYAFHISKLLLIAYYWIHFVIFSPTKINSTTGSTNRKKNKPTIHHIIEYYIRA